MMSLIKKEITAYHWLSLSLILTYLQPSSCRSWSLFWIFVSLGVEEEELRLGEVEHNRTQNNSQCHGRVCLFVCLFVCLSVSL